MTTQWIATHPRGPPRGHRPRADSRAVRGRDAATLTERLGVPVEKGPKDLREIPRYFGRAAARRRLRRLRTSRSSPRSTTPRSWPARSSAPPRSTSGRAAPTSSTSAARPGVPFPDLGERRARAPRRPGMRVSVDSLRPGRDPDGRRCRRRAGAERQRLATSRRRRSATPAATRASSSSPTSGDGLDDAASAASSALERWRVTYLIDPIIEPIGFGFMASLERYAEVHRRWPTRAADDGHRQHHRAHRGRHHRRQRAAHRDLRRRSACAPCSPPRSSPGPAAPCGRSTSRAGSCTTR